MDKTTKQCDGSKGFRHTKGDGSWWKNDARGIPLARVCGVCGACSKAKLGTFRPEVLSDPSYEADEPIG